MRNKIYNILFMLACFVILTSNFLHVIWKIELKLFNIDLMICGIFLLSIILLINYYTLRNPLLKKNLYVHDNFVGMLTFIIGVVQCTHIYSLIKAILTIIFIILIFNIWSISEKVKKIQNFK